MGLHRMRIFLPTLFALALLVVVGGGGTPDDRIGPPVRDSRRTFQRRMMSWQGLKQRNIVMQTTDYSCGAAALATIARYYWGDEVDEKYFLKAVEKILSKSEMEDRVKNGLSMTDLRKAAVKLGYGAALGKRTLEQLKEVKVPVIVRIVANEHEHFVVLRGVSDHYAYLADSIRGHVRVPLDEFSTQWKDRVLLVIAKPGGDLNNDSPLLVQPAERDVRHPELQTLRRALSLTPRPGGPQLP